MSESSKGGVHIQRKQKESVIVLNLKNTAPSSGVLRSLPLPPDRWGNARLIEGMVQGDPAAADVFFDRYGERVNKRVRYLIGRHRDAEDVVQRVFIELIDSVHTVRNPEALTGWVNRVSTFVVSKALRKEQRGRWLSFVDETPEMPVPGTQDTGMLIPRVREVLKKMRTTDSVVFVMRYVEEMDVSEIAEAFDWSITTSRRRIQRAREVFLKKARRDPLLAAYQESLKSER